MMASTLANNSSRTLPASGRKREQEIRLFASRRRYDCKRRLTSFPLPFHVVKPPCPSVDAIASDVFAGT